MSNPLNEELPKLSLVEQFNGICRQWNSLMKLDESVLTEVFQQMEVFRSRCMMVQQELENTNGKFITLQSENRKLNTIIKQIRHSYAKEIQLKDEMKQERDALRRQFESIRKFIKEEPHVNQHPETREKALSFIDLNRMDTVFEDEESEPSVVLDCDRSDDGMSVNDYIRRYKRKSSRQSNDSGARKSDASSKRMCQYPFTDSSEINKQIKVMEALIDVPEKEWHFLSTVSPHQSLLSSDRRESIGSRLLGGVMHRGTLTPLRQTLSKGLNLKPLF